MVHCSLSSLGYVVGGADTVVTALLELLGSSGTLVAMTGWEHDAYNFDEWPPALQDAYRRDPPAFDPAVSEAARDYGRLPERIRTWPNACHSSHPECRFSALGARA
jgi:aminoglycoside 3-N-acetyltransferase